MSNIDILKIMNITNDFLTEFDQKMVSCNWGYTHDDIRHSGASINTLENLGVLVAQILSQDDNIAFEYKEMAFARMKQRLFSSNFEEKISMFSKEKDKHIYDAEKIKTLITTSMKENIDLLVAMQNSIGTPISKTTPALKKGP